MTTNHPETCAVRPDLFDIFAVRKTAKNRVFVRNAIQALASVTLEDRNNIGVELSDELLDEAIEALSDVMLKHNIGVCRPGGRQKLLSDPVTPCYRYDPRSLMRCECYNEACPVSAWHKESGEPVDTLPLDDEDKDLLTEKENA